MRFTKDSGLKQQPAVFNIGLDREAAVTNYSGFKGVPAPSTDDKTDLIMCVRGLIKQTAGDEVMLSFRLGMSD